MNKEFYPDMVRELPEADLGWEGLRSWLLRGEHGLVSFIECDEEMNVPEHSHGPQFSVVLSGSIDITIDGRLHTYSKGDSFHIPAGVKHSARLSAGFHGLDFFDDNDRFKVKGF